MTGIMWTGLNTGLWVCRIEKLIQNIQDLVSVFFSLATASGHKLVINIHITESNTAVILTYGTLFLFFCSAFPEFQKMESSLWSTISSLHLQICNSSCYKATSQPKITIQTYISYFRPLSTLKALRTQMANREYEQQYSWALISYL